MVSSPNCSWGKPARLSSVIPIVFMTMLPGGSGGELAGRPFYSHNIEGIKSCVVALCWFITCMTNWCYGRRRGPGKVGAGVPELFVRCRVMRICIRFVVVYDSGETDRMSRGGLLTICIYTETTILCHSLASHVTSPVFDKY